MIALQAHRPAIQPPTITQKIVVKNAKKNSWDLTPCQDQIVVLDPLEEARGYVTSDDLMLQVQKLHKIDGCKAAQVFRTCFSIEDNVLLDKGQREREHVVS